MEENNKYESNSEWYYELNGKRLGPINLENLKTLIQNETINADSSIWRKGYEDWKRLRDTELKEFLLTDSPPPLTGEKVNNTIIWILAFVPLIGAFIEEIWKENNGIKMSDSASLALYFVLNSGFAIWDDYKLKNAGYKTNNLGWAIFLVPVYLWRRATLTKQSKLYFWIWIALIVLTIIITD